MLQTKLQSEAQLRQMSVKLLPKKNAFYIIFKTDMYLIIKSRAEEKELI